MHTANVTRIIGQPYSPLPLASLGMSRGTFVTALLSRSPNRNVSNSYTDPLSSLPPSTVHLFNEWTRATMRCLFQHIDAYKLQLLICNLLQYNKYPSYPLAASFLMVTLEGDRT